MYGYLYMQLGPPQIVNQAHVLSSLILQLYRYSYEPRSLCLIAAFTFLTILTTRSRFSGVIATQEQEMQVTRASVILRKPDNWSKWLFTRKISAD
jgi:hypothetical protein